MGDAGNPDTCCLSYFPKGCSFQNPHHHQSVRNCLQLGHHETASDPCQNQGNGACLSSLRRRAPQIRPVNSQEMGRPEEEHCLGSCQRTWDLWERWKSLSLYTELPVIHLCAGTMHTTADNRWNKSLTEGLSHWSHRMGWQWFRFRNGWTCEKEGKQHPGTVSPS